ncbi:MULTISPECIES: hypothetical protein [unclassified Streptomyces]|uniref:hypothetical protein n=1 Tax=unclassified Streptomyces TaxID=2593676 RepID=UPI002DD8D899|nr:MULTISPECIES: hypothetical protein [unclassified Streptomyces]WSA93655.1 hypothetical protein OIE63_20250 [Streptomyces sp. NBC_01795]WSB78027.1 hypothetical protein OHB04_21090 [Streptomyces sp. NBC_01775]WSS13721.1 hypothetical protein OG533_18890 [Streptomyces sp. NBC_01186]WSS42543.1 hypothetical protein OG220_19640 [Streptomyces sp. NBC_01187]
MAQAVGRRPLSFLNTDGKPHPVENSFAAVTMLLGLVAAVSAFWTGMHPLSCWAGLAGILTGLWGQFISATTGERFVTIIGLGAAAVGFYLGMAHGGLLP